MQPEQSEQSREERRGLSPESAACCVEAVGFTDTLHSCPHR